MRYVPKVARTGPKEEPIPGKKFDDEANTRADLLADISLSHDIKAEDSSNIIIKNANEESETNDDAGGSKKCAKSRLLETVAANKWKPPVFECFKEEGPCHKKLFTYKVAIEIEAEVCSVLECFGDRKPRKKTAAQNAAEGALWYLKHVGYFPIIKSNNF